MKIKTSGLSDIQLCWAVAFLDGWLEEADDTNDGNEFYESVYMYGSCNYTTDWAQGGPIIERELIAVDWDHDTWNAAKDSLNWYVSGPTPLVAAMRCYVQSKLGDEVEIPEELLT